MISLMMPPAISSPAPERQASLNGVRIALYGVQIADSLITSNAIKQCGGRENFMPLRPFSHGGAATYAVGFAALDLITHALFRHTRFARVMEGVQIAGSVVGLQMDAAGQRDCR